MRSLKENLQAVVDLSVVLMIIIAFAGLMVIGYIIWTVRDQLSSGKLSSDANATLDEITDGFDDAVGLILVAITIFVLAIAISALLMLRGRQ
jgi:TRAP-type C4-dicarboxylate transport system permease small subunit